MDEFFTKHTSITFSIHHHCFPVYSLEGEEALSEPFLFKSDILANFSLTDLLAIQGVKGTLVFSASNNKTKEIIGLITHIEQRSDLHDNNAQFRLTLEPNLVSLKKSSGPRLFLHMSIVDLINNLLIKHGYQQSQIVWHLNKKFPTLEQIMQLPQESDFDLITRLLSKNNIFYWFSTGDYLETICFCDDRQQLIHFASQEMLYQKSKKGFLPVINSELGFNELKVHRQLMPNQFIYSNYDQETSDSKQILVSSVHTKSVKHIEFDNDVVFKQNSIKEDDLSAQKGLTDAFFLEAKGDAITLNIASEVKLNAQQFNDNYTMTYFVVGLQHRYCRSPHWENSVVYTQTAILVPNSAIFRTRTPVVAKKPLIFTAFIEDAYSTSYPDLNEQGSYFIHYDFEIENRSSGQTSMPVRRLSQQAGAPLATGESSGFHTPLVAKNEVIISFWNNDPERPVILNSVPNAQTKSPVTLCNPSENWLRTPGGNQLLMSDNEYNPEIKIATKDSLNYFCLNSGQGNPGIFFHSQLGTISLQSAADLSFDCKEDLDEQITRDRHHSIEASFTAEIGRDARFDAAQDQYQTAKEAMRWQAGRNITVNSGSSIHFTANADMFFNISGDIFKINVQKGNFLLSAADEILIQGTGQGIIEMGQPNCGIRFQGQDSIVLFGDNIQLTALQSLTMKGKIIHQNDSL